ncbi:MAG: 1-deoxy-D-xylulose-5-phosphate reductoisomerase [Fusobacteriaceae bacterium]
MKHITILGSTGSIGVNALEVIRSSPDKFKVVGLSGNKNLILLESQIREFNPKYVAVGSEDSYKIFKNKFPNVEILVGDEGLKNLGALDESDILLTAVSGAIGIDATIESIKKGKRIALANKETMVAAGDYINELLKKNPDAHIIPVDSEHSAIFQSMLGGKRDEVSKLIITASGGTFRGKTSKELENVKVEEALKHPNWSMGRKITIDSSTLVNKGLEVIEAHQLFGINYDDIQVVVHPQSIIHSMVEFKDTSIIAQLGIPDMKLPIQFSFTYPERFSNKILERLDFKKLSSLTFLEPDHETFRGIKLAFSAGKIGGTMPTVLNAANECAVDLFLNGKIKFLEIYNILEDAMDNHKSEKITDINMIKLADKITREKIYKKYI